MIREQLGKEIIYFLTEEWERLLQAKGLAPGELPETWNLTSSGGNPGDSPMPISRREVILY